MTSHLITRILNLKLWPNLLQDRLDWEEAAGLVSREMNKGWLFPFNDHVSTGSDPADPQDHRRMLRWVMQVDSVNCGPLAVACVVLAAEGYRPSVQSLGSKMDPLSRANHALLRDCIVMRFVKAAKRAQPEGWLAHPTVTREMQEWEERMRDLVLWLENRPWQSIQ